MSAESNPLSAEPVKLAAFMPFAWALTYDPNCDLFTLSQDEIGNTEEIHFQPEQAKAIGRAILNAAKAHKAGEIGPG